MTVNERIRVCQLAEKIRLDKEFADLIKVYDRSHYGSESSGDEVIIQSSDTRSYICEGQNVD